MKKNLLPAIVFAALLTGSCQNTESTEKISQASVSSVQQEEKLTGDKFMRKAYMGNRAEVQLGNMASQKTRNKDVKQFALMMIEDHGKANKELISVARRKDLRLLDTLSGEMKQKMDSLQSLSGREFDQAYMNFMVKDHQEDVKFYNRALSEIEDTDLKTYARNTLPTLQKHLDRAQEVNQTLQAAEVRRK